MLASAISATRSQPHDGSGSVVRRERETETETTPRGNGLEGRKENEKQRKTQRPPNGSTIFSSPLEPSLL
jgi:hypothetical protein